MLLVDSLFLKPNCSIIRIPLSLKWCIILLNITFSSIFKNPVKRKIGLNLTYSIFLLIQGFNNWHLSLCGKVPLDNVWLHMWLTGPPILTNLLLQNKFNKSFCHNNKLVLFLFQTVIWTTSFSLFRSSLGSFLCVLCSRLLINWSWTLVMFYD